MRIVQMLLFLGLAASARASTLKDELSTNTSQSTQSSPRAGNLADTLSGELTLSDAWSLTGSATLSAEGRTPAAQQGAFGVSASAATAFSFGVDYDSEQHLSLGLLLDFSPSSTQYAGTDLTLSAPSKPTRTANALVKSDSSSVDLALDLGYDTAGESDFEWAFNGGLTLSTLDSQQNVSAVRYDGSKVIEKKDQLVTFCASHPCSRNLTQALKDNAVTLHSAKLSAGATLTAWADTDFGVSADVYAYAEDPTQLGYFSVAYSGKSTAVGGNGIPIAPLRFTVRPEVEHRFGDLSVQIYLQAGQYIAGGGKGTAGIGGKLQYKFTRQFKVWIKGSGQSDTDEQDQQTNSGTFALGAGYRF